MPSPARVGDVRRTGTLGQSLVGCGGVLRVGEVVASRPGSRGPEKLSLSRGILARGQTPIGMRTSRCLWGGSSSEGGASLLRSSLSLLLTRRESPRGCLCSRDSCHSPSLGGHLERATWTLLLLVPLQGLGKGLYLSTGSPNRSSPKMPSASRISCRKIFFQALGGGE